MKVENCDLCGEETELILKFVALKKGLFFDYQDKEICEKCCNRLTKVWRKKNE